MSDESKPIERSNGAEEFPDFTFRAYRELLIRLSDRYHINNCTRVLNAFYKPEKSQASSKPLLLLRHDVDFQPEAALALAEIEAKLGVSASYFVGFFMYYNADWEPNKEIFRRLIGLGHEVGLHYDVSQYASDPEQREAMFRFELQRLSNLIGEPVRCASMHIPSINGNDPFADSAIVLNPSDPAFLNEVVYISDSTRAWRDDNIVKLQQGSLDSKWFMINLHPILWSEVEMTDRLEFLCDTIATRYDREVRDILIKARPSWLGHRGGQTHDRRCGIFRETEDE